MLEPFSRALERRLLNEIKRCKSDMENAVGVKPDPE